MKQFISTQQLSELTELGRKNLQKWYVVSEGDRIAWKNNSRQKQWGSDINYPDSDYGFYVDPGKKLTGKWELPLLSMGQMLEFLDERDSFTCRRFIDTNNSGWQVLGRKVNSLDTELCDALWNATKQFLEET